MSKLLDNLVLAKMEGEITKDIGVDIKGLCQKNSFTHYKFHTLLVLHTISFGHKILQPNCA